MPELIRDEKTGFLVKNIDEAVEAVENVKYIKREDCRLWALSLFSAENVRLLFSQPGDVRRVRELKPPHLRHTYSVSALVRLPTSTLGSRSTSQPQHSSF